MCLRLAGFQNELGQYCYSKWSPMVFHCQWILPQGQVIDQRTTAGDCRIQQCHVQLLSNPYQQVLDYCHCCSSVESILDPSDIHLSCQAGLKDFLDFVDAKSVIVSFHSLEYVTSAHTEFLALKRSIDSSYWFQDLSFIATWLGFMNQYGCQNMHINLPSNCFVRGLQMTGLFQPANSNLIYVHYFAVVDLNQLNQSFIEEPVMAANSTAGFAYKYHHFRPVGAGGLGLRCQSLYPQVGEFIFDHYKDT